MGTLEGFQTASLIALKLAGSDTAEHAPVAAAAAAYVAAAAVPPRAAISLSGAPNPDTPACESARGITYWGNKWGAGGGQERERAREEGGRGYLAGGYQRDPRTDIYIYYIYIL